MDKRFFLFLLHYNITNVLNIQFAFYLQKNKNVYLWRYEYNIWINNSYLVGPDAWSVRLRAVYISMPKKVHQHLANYIRRTVRWYIYTICHNIIDIFYMHIYILSTNVQYLKCTANRGRRSRSDVYRLYDYGRL